MAKIILSSGATVHTGFLKSGGSAGTSGETVSVAPVYGGTKTVLKKKSGAVEIYSGEQNVQVGKTTPEEEFKPVVGSTLESQQKNILFESVKQPMSTLTPTGVYDNVRSVGEFGIEDEYLQQSYFGNIEDIREDYSTQIAKQRTKQQDMSIGVYDKIKKETRLANVLESVYLGQQIEKSKVSTEVKPKEESIKELLQDKNVQKIYFTQTPEGTKPLLTQRYPEKYFETWYKADPTQKKSLYEKTKVEGFFNPKSKNFLDLTQLSENVRELSTEWYKDPLTYEFERENKNQAIRTLKGTGIIIGGGLISFGAGFVTGVTMPFRHPIKTYEGFKEMVFHPISSAETMAYQAATDPFGTAGEFYGFGKAGKLIKKGSPIELEFEQLGEGGSKVAGINVGYELTGIKTYAKTFSKDLLIGEEFIQPKTKVGTKAYVDMIEKIITEPTEMLVEGKTISPELQQEYLRKALESTGELKTVKSKFLTKEGFKSQQTKYLTQKEYFNLVENIGVQKGAIFGSSATMPQLDPLLRREIGDVEAKWNIESEAKLKAITKENLKVLQKTSPESEFIITPEEPFHIEKKVDGTFQKAAEFKGQGIGEGDVAPEFAFGYDLWAIKDFTTIEKNTLAMLRGELKRKTAGSLMLSPETKTIKLVNEQTKLVFKDFQSPLIDYFKTKKLQTKLDIQYFGRQSNLLMKQLGVSAKDFITEGGLDLKPTTDYFKTKKLQTKLDFLYLGRQSDLLMKQLGVKAQELIPDVSGRLKPSTDYFKTKKLQTKLDIQYFGRQSNLLMKQLGVSAKDFITEGGLDLKPTTDYFKTKKLQTKLDFLYLGRQSDLLMKQLGVKAQELIPFEIQRSKTIEYKQETTRSKLGVAHPGRYKDVADLYRIAESLAKSTNKPTPKTKAFLETAEKLGVDYKTQDIAKLDLEIGEPRKRNPTKPSPLNMKNLQDFENRLLEKLDKSPRSPSPKELNRILSPSFSPRKSRSPSPSISPSLSPYLSPKLSPSPSPRSRSPSPSISPSLSPYLSPSPSISPSLSPYLSPSPSPSPRASPSPYKNLVGISSPIINDIKNNIKQAQQNSKKFKADYAYSQDFTSKALGLNIKIKSKKDLKKLIMGQYTGLEFARYGIKM